MRSRSGFVILLFMAVLLVFGVFSLLAGRLLVSSFRIARDSHERQTQAMRMDAMLSRLRADVWEAQRIDVAGPKLDLALGGGKRVTWRCENGAVSRIEGQDTEQWAGMGVDLSFVHQSAMVLVQVAEAPVKRINEVALVSQAMLAERGRP